MDNRELYIPRGKSLGGSSSMNAMLYVRGRPLDYDLWEAQGAPGWGWDDVLPYFLRSEDNARGASEFHGAGGPLRVSEQRSPRPMNRAPDRRQRGRRHPALPRLQRARAGRRGHFPGDPAQRAALERGRRLPAPVLDRPNLRCAPAHRSGGMELEGDRAVGVRMAGRFGREESVRAEREVILSAGRSVAPAAAAQRHRAGRRPALGGGRGAPRRARAWAATSRTTRS